MMKDFLRCAIDGDLTALGQGSPAERADAWLKLSSDYNEVIGSRVMTRHIDDSKANNAIALKTEAVNTLIDLLSVAYSEKYVECLRLWGYDLPFTAESIEKDLEKVRRKLANEVTKVQIKQSVQPIKEGEKPTKEDYIRLLLQINRHNGLHYRMSDISALEFALLYKELSDYSQKIANKDAK